MDLITLADLPELRGSDPKPRVTIAVGRLDDNLRDPRYGRFAITQRQVDGWKRNLSETFGGQVSIDFDHSSDRGNGTKAAAWIKGLHQDGKLITADVEFTRRGARSVRDGDYKYTSPTFVENYVDEHGEKHGPALIGAALTNRPVLRKGMPTLSLSQDVLDGVAVPGGDAKAERKRARRELAKLLSVNSEGPRDSRPQMDLAKLTKLLDLDADADEATVLAKVTELAKPAEPAEPSADDEAARKAAKKARKLAKQNGQKTVTLAEKTFALDEQGNVLLDAQGLADLVTAANAGQAAATQLAEQTFTVAWDKALLEGRAAPAQEKILRALHRENPELAIQTLDSFVKIVPTRPAGSGDAGAATGAAPAGVDEERFALHNQATTLAAQKRKDDPKLDEAEAYILATIEIEERQFALANPGI